MENTTMVVSGTACIKYENKPHRLTCDERCVTLQDVVDAAKVHFGDIDPHRLYLTQGRGYHDVEIYKLSGQSSTEADGTKIFSIPAVQTLGQIIDCLRQEGGAYLAQYATLGLFNGNVTVTLPKDCLPDVSPARNIA
jgi:hypothetical protein